MAPDPSPPAQDVERPVAFVLSGGGNLGALQVGMLRALLEHGERPDLVVGCSVGAINGASFAAAPTLEGVANLERVWQGLEGQNLLPSGWSNAVSLARRGEAIHDHSGLRRMAKQALGATTFEQLELRFECVATDVAGAREVWFDSGPLVEPILASAALPAIYPAVEIDGVRYLDGGIVNDVPMSRAVELGARTIYILQVGSFMRPRREPRRPLDVAVQAYWVARHHRFKRELEALPPDVAVHVLPTGETPRMRFNDFTHSATLIARAYEAATAYLDDLAAGTPPAPALDRSLANGRRPAPGVALAPRPALDGLPAAAAIAPLPVPGAGTELAPAFDPDLAPGSDLVPTARAGPALAARSRPDLAVAASAGPDVAAASDLATGSDPDLTTGDDLASAPSTRPHLTTGNDPGLAPAAGSDPDLVPGFDPTPTPGSGAELGCATVASSGSGDGNEAVRGNGNGKGLTGLLTGNGTRRWIGDKGAGKWSGARRWPQAARLRRIRARPLRRAPASHQDR